MFSKSQYQTASDIVQLANAIIWLRNNQLQQFHLTSSQSDALLYILRQPEDQEITAGSLIQDLHLSQSTVAGITKRLEAKGLIRRTVSPDDNRKSIIAVTEQGRCLMEALRSNAVRTESLLLTSCRQGLINIPLLLLMNHLFGLFGVVWTQLLADSITVVISFALYRRVHRQLEALPI